MTDDRTLTVDLDGFVADNFTSRFDSNGNRFFTQPDEVRVSSPYGNGWSVVDDHGHPFASGMRSREDAEFVARCVNAVRGVTPVPGTEEGAEINRKRNADAEVRRVERELDDARERARGI